MDRDEKGFDDFFVWYKVIKNLSGCFDHIWFFLIHNNLLAQTHFNGFYPKKIIVARSQAIHKSQANNSTREQGKTTWRKEIFQRELNFAVFPTSILINNKFKDHHFLSSVFNKKVIPIIISDTNPDISDILSQLKLS